MTAQKGGLIFLFSFFFSLMEKRGNRFILFNTESSAVCI